jgi:phosphonate transport system substrate-binding protein
VLSVAVVATAFGVWWWNTQGNAVAVSPAVANTVADNSSHPGVRHASRPVLRVAVADMVSPQVTQQYYEELLRLIGDRVGRDVEFVQRKEFAQVNELLERQAIDLAFVCSGPYVRGHEKFGMEILAVPIVHGKAVSHTYFIVNRNSAAKSLNDLRGKTFAFTDPTSNTGCLVPKYLLAQRGETTRSFFGSTFFTHSHDNSIKAVAEGLADGAAVNQMTFDFVQATDPTYVRKTKVIAKSPPYGTPPIVVHPHLDASLKRALQQVFLSLHEHEDSRRLLYRLQIDRFTQGDDAMYASVRQVQQWLADHATESP